MNVKEVWNFCCVVFSRKNSDFIVVNPLVSGVLRSFTKLIDKKLERYPYTKKDNLIYINTNVEYVSKILNVTKDHSLQYIKCL